MNHTQIHKHDWLYIHHILYTRFIMAQYEYYWDSVFVNRQDESYTNKYINTTDSIFIIYYKVYTLFIMAQYEYYWDSVFVNRQVESYTNT